MADKVTEPVIFTRTSKVSRFENINIWQGKTINLEVFETSLLTIQTITLQKLYFFRLYT